MKLNHSHFDSFSELEYSPTLEFNPIAFYVNCLSVVSSLNNQSFYVINFENGSFEYVSNLSLFLCGHSVEQVKKWGLSFFEKVVASEDREMIEEISEKSLAFFQNLPLEKRWLCCLSCDFFMLQSNQTYLLTNHKIMPLVLSPEGDLKLAIGLTSLSTNNTSGHVLFTLINEREKYEYSFASKRFKPCPLVSFTNREKEVLKYMVVGKTDKEIASALKIKPDTIKYHKKNIFRKQGVRNNKQAVNNAMTSLDI